MKSAAIVAVLVATACIPEEGPMMAPFQDCLACHRGGEEQAWTAAGTWRRGSRVSITDRNGKTVPLRGNDAENFYTAEPLAFPITVSVDGKVMPVPGAPGSAQPAEVSFGGCNLCHHAEQALALDEFMLPGTDCLACHGPGGMAARKFSAAGTFGPPRYPAGSAVSVGGRTTATNAVGNFFIEASITFPATARVPGETMSPNPDYSGCNRCHGPGGEADED